MLSEGRGSRRQRSRSSRSRRSTAAHRSRGVEPRGSGQAAVAEEHRQLFAAFMGGAHGGMPQAEMDGMFRAQCAWDAVMAHNALKALAAEPDPRAVLVVMAGFGHAVTSSAAPSV
jgi:uncharacterized iron-regulated protein